MSAEFQSLTWFSGLKREVEETHVNTLLLKIVILSLVVYVM